VRSVSVPGNLLVTGEYVIVEEGGIGLACAIAPRVLAWLESGPELRVEGRTGNGVRQWREGAPNEADPSPLFDAVLPYLLDHNRIRHRGRVVVDSTAFFGPDGRKLGFGSSAAVTLAVTSLLCAEPQTPEQTLLSLALDAHRHFQGGRGSGYDVATSFYGGVGVFTGGATPSWTPASGWWLQDGVLVVNREHTSTPAAVSRHADWRAEHPEKWKRLRRKSRDATEALADAHTWQQVGDAFAAARDAGREIGAEIGVSACTEHTFDTGLLPERGMCKAVGAGSELAICLRDPMVDHAAPEGGTGAVLPLIVEQEGLLWE
jgi:phosphomevalonate kinase